MKRYLFLVLFAFTSVGVHAGIYQRTRYTHVLVWNDQPTSFQEVTWSGGKDEKGYATGDGTVTWFAPDKPPMTGSILPSRRKMIVVRSATGTMERGKLVNAPKASKPKPRERNQRPESSPAPESSPEQSREKEPASTPSPSPKTTSSASTPSPTPSPSPRDESINSLTRPPSSLQLSSPAVTPASPHPTESASPSP